MTWPKRNRHYRRAIALAEATLAEATLFDSGSHMVLKDVLRGNQRRK